MAKYAAFGAKLLYDVASTWTVIAGIRDISGPGLSLDTADATTHDSTDAFREHLPTLKDGGELSLELVFDPEETAGQQKLLNNLMNGTVESFRIEFNTTGNKQWEISTIVTGFEPGQPLEDLITASVTLKITGKPNLSPT